MLWHHLKSLLTRVGMSDSSFTSSSFCSIPIGAPNPHIWRNVGSHKSETYWNWHNWRREMLGKTRGTWVWGLGQLEVMVLIVLCVWVGWVGGGGSLSTFLTALPLFSGFLSGMVTSGSFLPSQPVTVPKTTWHRFESLNLNYGQSVIREAYRVGSPTVTYSAGAGLQGREPAGLREQTCWPQHRFLSPAFLKDASPALLSIRDEKLEPEPGSLERQRTGLGIPLEILLASGELLTSCCLLPTSILPPQGTEDSDSLLLTWTLFVYPSAGLIREFYVIKTDSLPSPFSLHFSQKSKLSLFPWKWKGWSALCSLHTMDDFAFPTPMSLLRAISPCSQLSLVLGLT